MHTAISTVSGRHNWKFLILKKKRCPADTDCVRRFFIEKMNKNAEYRPYFHEKVRESNERKRQKMNTVK